MGGKDVPGSLLVTSVPTCYYVFVRGGQGLPHPVSGGALNTNYPHDPKGDLLLLDEAHLDAARVFSEEEC